MYKYVLICILFLATKVYSIEIESYYGKYDTSNKKPWLIAPSLEGPVIESWDKPLASKKYNIGVLVPHIKDDYWKSIVNGLVSQAKKLNVSILVLSADGYANIDVQKRQFIYEILRNSVDGILLAPITYDSLDVHIARMRKSGIPVVSMVNDIHAPHISAKVLTCSERSGKYLANFILEDAVGEDINIAFFPGPEKAAWAKTTYEGFVKALGKNENNLPSGKITIVSEQYGGMNSTSQRNLINRILQIKSDINYIIGNAVAAKEAVPLALKHKTNHPKAKIISTYMLPEMYKSIEKGDLYAAVTDKPINLARLSLDVLVRILNGEKIGDKNSGLPFQSGPTLRVLSRKDLHGISSASLFGDFSDNLVLEYTPA